MEGITSENVGKISLRSLVMVGITILLLAMLIKTGRQNPIALGMTIALTPVMVMAVGFFMERRRHR